MRYLIDANASKLTVRVFAMGMMASLGHNPIFAVRKFEGEIELDEQATGSARLTLDSTSLELQGDIGGRDRWDIVHIMQDDILEIAAFPTIMYEAPVARTAVKSDGSNQYDVALTGDLTLHGTTRMQPVNARVLLHGGMLRASGEVPIQQTEYQLKVVRVPGSLLKIKDEVKLTFDVVAHK